ncbi:polysaccharide pyruvyl transferase family protein [Desulfosporosinus sp. Sb-LF]|uniref:polysaccharide pyruvyl transferase family protein n=1 Tax=Desulfosporosinus sp. Sb-LF TaxID=2560027 RepID=UPI00107FBAA8|nr:polysaccharide pyruvyl transferase family protein [Desulfosporosinus sp. Sb-LF]TGE33794.1 hypothetical protein E4K68_02950 [Desulfosporosinus sp. Sb-LF]
MKYGLLVFQETTNIGDDIQSFAAKRFLPQVDYMIDRESLDLFVPEKREQIATIMNAWYMYRRYNWPPSPYIYPLLLSIHFSNVDYSDYLGIGSNFLEGMGKEYLKNYGPVGCRDDSTLQLLKEKQISSYLSGCLTLTLSRNPEIVQGNYICLVDVDDEIAGKVKACVKDREIKMISQTVNYNKHPISWETRFERVQALLNLYQGAACVVTSRLHCALPCLALGTPVLLINQNVNSDRFSNFLPFLNYTSKQKFMDDVYYYDFASPLPNKEDYLSTRKALIEKCERFVNSVKMVSLIDKSLPEIIDFKSFWLEKASWQKSIIAGGTNKYQSVIDNNVKYIHELMNEKKWLLEQVDNYQKEDEKKTIAISSLKDWINELERAKKWLEEQWNAQKSLREEKDIYLSQVLKDKEWLEEQWNAQKSLCEEKDIYLSQVLKDKEWLEKQWNMEKTLREKQEILISREEEEIAELKNKLVKVEYKFNRIKNDSLVKKIIKLKRYEI